MNHTSPLHILSGLRDGVRVYWTGRAGAAFVSTNRRDAFGAGQYWCSVKRDFYNQHTSTHGIKFDLIEAVADSELGAA